VKQVADGVYEDAVFEFPGRPAVPGHMAEDEKSYLRSLRVPPEVPLVAVVVLSELLYFDGATRRA
jgi:hypothetical protein